MSVNNIRRGTVSDLSLGNTVTATRLPIQAISPTGDNGDVIFIDRPYFYYNGQWNTMASLSDIPTSPSLFSTGTLYAASQIDIVAPAYQFTLTGLTADGIVNMNNTDSYLEVLNSGYYTITIQATIEGLGPYFGTNTKLFIYAQTGTNQYLMNAGWQGGQQNLEFLTITATAVKYLEAGTIVLFYILFDPAIGSGAIKIYGGPQDSTNLGMCSYLQVTWAGEAPTFRSRRPPPIDTRSESEWEEIQEDGIL